MNGSTIFVNLQTFGKLFAYAFDSGYHKSFNVFY